MVAQQTIIFKKIKESLVNGSKKNTIYTQLQNFMNLLDKVDFTDGALAFV